MRIARFMIILMVLLAGIAFHLRNDQFVRFDYYLGDVDLPFSLWIFIAMSTGAVLGCLALTPVLVKLRHESVRLRRQIKVSETELNNLRVIPIKE